MLILMTTISSVALAACSKSGGDSDADVDPGEYEDEYLDSIMTPEDDGPSDFDQPKYDYEDDGEDLVKEEHPVEDYYGIWEATSQRSAYMYGNVDINIKEDGTWKGNITEENFHGTWIYKNGSVVIKDTEEIIDFTLFYNDRGYMMFCNNEIPEDSFVLEKQVSN